MHPTYKKMLKKLQEKEKTSKHKVKDLDDWSLYVLECCDGSFYTGIAKDVERRFKMHQNGKASRYTRVRRPVELLYQEKCGSHTKALVRECEVKEWPRTKKERLVNGLINKIQPPSSKQKAKKKNSK